MHVLYDKYPNTIIICFIWSVIGLFLILLNINDILRIMISLPMIIFIPGYLSVFALFPSKKTEKGLEDVERIALSIGVSMAIVPLIGLILINTPWGIGLLPIVFSLELFAFIVGFIALYRWLHTSPEDRYRLTINVTLTKQETKGDKILTAILVFFIIIAVGLVVYVISTPKQGEHFTEFYILGPSHIASDYPSNLTIGKNTSVILGIINHEYTPVNYTIEVWLSNQSTVYNTTKKANETIYHHFWFWDSINTTLNPEPINLENTSELQWEYNYSFHINERGQYKLIFLLYTNHTRNYIKEQDYQTMALQKADEYNTTAYRNIYLWITVS
jgi:uncharacterized membrane protein